mmetsp:Transcript_54675/g.176829  ORF Transcript_54675/g.176829 Transcript_54675/m.176829 type:complete len:222 (+) Transcript_54675:51-716(+)
MGGPGRRLAVFTKPKVTAQRHRRLAVFIKPKVTAQRHRRLAVFTKPKVTAQRHRCPDGPCSIDGVKPMSAHTDAINSGAKPRQTLPALAHQGRTEYLLLRDPPPRRQPGDGCGSSRRGHHRCRRGRRFRDSAGGGAGGASELAGFRRCLHQRPVREQRGEAPKLLVLPTPEPFLLEGPPLGHRVRVVEVHRGQVDHWRLALCHEPPLRRRRPRLRRRCRSR